MLRCCDNTCYRIDNTHDIPTLTGNDLRSNFKGEVDYRGN